MQVLLTLMFWINTHTHRHTHTPTTHHKDHKTSISNTDVPPTTLTFLLSIASYTNKAYDRNKEYIFYFLLDKKIVL